VKATQRKTAINIIENQAGVICGKYLKEAYYFYAKHRRHIRNAYYVMFDLGEYLF
jgi:hypothetical protein